MMRRWRTAVLLAAAATFACTDDVRDTTGPGIEADVPDPGFVAVRLTTPNPNDGALVLQLSGGERVVDSLIGSTGSVFTAVTGPNSFRIMLAGAIGDGPVMRFWMPDRRDVALYTATLEQAAARSTYQQQDISGYSLSIAK